MSRRVFFVSLAVSFVLLRNAITPHRGSVSLEATEIKVKKNEAATCEALFEAATLHAQTIRNRYLAANKSQDFGMRGLGWLHEQHNLSLALSASQRLRISETRSKPYSFVIVDVNGNQCDPSRLTIWVRVSGPEVFAGSAVPAKSDCSWYFEVPFAVPGNYTVEAKLVTFDGRVDVHNDLCFRQKMDARQRLHSTYSNYTSIRGFKFYDPAFSCCEVCSRVPGCVAWSSPSVDRDKYFPNANQAFKECDIFFDKLDANHRRLFDGFEFHNGPAFGKPRNETTRYFLGCAWSFWHSHEHPCLFPTDDMIYVSNSQLAVGMDSNNPQSEELPLCKSSDEFLEHHSGRWVRRSFPNETACPLGMEPDPIWGTKNFMIQHDPERPHCWHREDLTQLGTKCVERQCRLHSDIAIQSQWQSHLHREHQWYGTWEPYTCQYLEFTNKQLQQCVDRNRIASVEIKGASIASFLQNYANQRTEGIEFAKPEDGPTVNVSLSTLAMPHLLWHLSLPEAEEHFRRMPDATDSDWMYFMTGFYYSSEREPHVVVDRSEQFSRIAEQVLIPKGYRVINAFGLSAAFTYDSAAQMDGMHLVGPPMKMIVVELLHYMCADS